MVSKLKMSKLFVCQVEGDSVKLIIMRGRKGEAARYRQLPLKDLVPELKRLGFNNDNMIFSLPRSLAASRYIKIPSHSPPEIERMVNLQAPRFLPYPAEELITGFEIVSLEKDGSSRINLAIAQKDTINRLLGSLSGLKRAKIDVFISSYGLCGLYNHFIPKGKGATALIDADAGGMELAVVLNGKLAFSRHSKFDASPGWKSFFIEELKKTRDSYAKEISPEPWQRIYVFGKTAFSEQVKGVLNEQAQYPVEAVTYGNSADSEASFAALTGLGLKKTKDDYFSLLPADLKAGYRRIARRKKAARIIICACAVVLIVISAFSRNLRAKAEYAKELKEQAARMAIEAKPLERIEKALRVMESRRKPDMIALNALFELHQVTPEGIYLYSFNFEEGNGISVRGQAQELNSVFEFLSSMERSPAFKRFGLKVKYAAHKKTQSGETVDFEIFGLKR